MKPLYYLHGDQEDFGSNDYYCKKCDIFAEQSHFDNEPHGATTNKSIRHGLKFLAHSENPLRSDNWHNIFDRKLLLELDDLNPLSSKNVRRKAITPSTRFSILKRDKYTCQICGRRQSNGITLHIDHRIAVAKGGTNDIKKPLDSMFSL